MSSDDDDDVIEVLESGGSGRKRGRSDGDRSGARGESLAAASPSRPG